MRQRILTLLVALVAIVGVKAQTQNNAMYVYRNDGRFNAFLREDITQIVLSDIDTLGVKTNSYVVQEFHTKDSIYRIPISAIDSVSFVQPETKYRDNVMILTEEHLPYISAVTDNTITFKSSTPSKLMPKKGSVLASMTTKAPLTRGFAGKVTKEESANGGKKFTCEDVVLEDIFERLVYVGKAKTTNFDTTTRAYDGDETTETATRAADTRADGEGSFTIPTLEFALGGPFSASVDYAVDVHFAIAIGIFDIPHLSISAIQHESATVSIGTGDALKVGWNHVWWKDVYTFYIPSVPGLGITITPGFFLDMKTGMEFTMSAKIKTKKVVQLILDENEQRYTNHDMPMHIKPTVTGAVNFEVSLGPCAELSVVYISKNVCSIDVAGFVGIYGKGEGNVSWTPGATSDQTAEYRYLKDSKLEAGLWAAGYAGASVATSKLNFFSPYGFKQSSEMPDFPVVIRKPYLEYYLFPEFKRPSINQDSKTGFLIPTSTPSRNVVSPMPIGFSLYDVKAKKHVAEIWMEKDYNEEEAWNKAHTMREQLRPANILTDYQVFPMLQYKTRKIYAEPVSQTFQLKAEVTTGAATNIKETSASISGSAQNVIFEDERYGVSGFLLSPDPTVDPNNKSTKYIDAQNTQGKPNFTVNITSGLTPNTKYYYRAFVALKNVDPIYGEIRSFETGKEQEQSTVGKAVDLGLPSGTKWADHNLGTDKNTGTGQFFAWGEVSSKSSYTSQNSKWYNMSTQQLIKQGVVDEEAILTPDYDAATRMWGSGWMIPSLDDYKELFSNCELKLGTMNNVWGMQAKGNNGNTIFFPGVGIMNGTSREYAGNTGIYWTADTDYDESNTAFAIYVDNTGDLDIIRPNRYFGLPIRPIYVESTPGTDYEYVDLGLSVLWATHNVGAKKPEDYGNYYAPAETQPKNTYTKENWFLSSNNYDAYCEAHNITYGEFVDMVVHKDGKGNWILNSSFDAATVNWGEPWRLPTQEELQELVEKCKWEKYPANDTYGTNCQGYKVTGPSGKSIYLPIAGQYTDKLEIPGGKTNSQAFYLSSTGFAVISGFYVLWLYPFIDSIDPNTSLSVHGYSVRPVMPKK